MVPADSSDNGHAAGMKKRTEAPAAVWCGASGRWRRHPTATHDHPPKLERQQTARNMASVPEEVQPSSLWARVMKMVAN